MAKKNKTKGHLDGADAIKAGLLALGADLVGRLITQMSKEGFNLFTPGAGGGSSGGFMSGGDDARKVLKTLADDGSQTIDELIEASGVNLGTLLISLHAAKEFGLVDYDRDRGEVSLTDTGRRLTQNVKKSTIRETADRLLSH